MQHFEYYPKINNIYHCTFSFSYQTPPMQTYESKQTVILNSEPVIDTETILIKRLTYYFLRFLG